jgi:hypothetical protein
VHTRRDRRRAVVGTAAAVIAFATAGILSAFAVDLQPDAGTTPDATVKDLSGETAVEPEVVTDPVDDAGEQPDGPGPGGGSPGNGPPEHANGNGNGNGNGPKG